ncbi:hypothetical protein AAFF_G00008790 [Aldrovandia affinis]|uniref:Uncharacterized protein n=1 Tax=Aldrovandia affinis TaxID=143900 RepID=A0AAD7WZ86_9TELE|nr:hypothetical protein AAFF_G00008790 [Aldrovandia affinis]
MLLLLHNKSEPHMTPRSPFDLNRQTGSPLLVRKPRESGPSGFPHAAIIERLPPASSADSARETREKARISPCLPGHWAHARSMSPAAWPGFKSSCQLNWTVKMDSFFS